MDILLQISYWILTHGAHILSIVAIIGVPVWGWWQWRRRQFLSWVNIGLHTCEPQPVGWQTKHRLLLRDLANVSVSDLTNGNAHAAKILIAAAKHTGSHKPILRFQDHDEKIVLNMARGYISGLFREGLLRRDLELPHKSGWYRAFLVCEVKADIRRITIIVIRRDRFTQPGIFDHPKEWSLEVRKHDNRLATLKHLQDACNGRIGSYPPFIDLELCVPA